MRKLIVLALALSLAGCATIEKNPNSAKLVTQYAVLKFAEQSSPERRAARLENVKKIAADVKAIAANEDASIGFLQSAVDLQIAKLNLSPADKLLAKGLVDMISQELLKRVGAGALSPDAKVQVSLVMDWILEAAAMA